MTPAIETSLLIAGISMAGIFVFMTLFYLVIVGLDKLLPFPEEKPEPQFIEEEYSEEEEE